MAEQKEELKTLKDLESCGGGFGDSHGISDYYSESETGELEDVKKERLRQEIIKWINIGGSFDKLIKEYMKNKFSYELIEDDLEEFACDVLMHIFNITEEDLK